MLEFAGESSGGNRLSDRAARSMICSVGFSPRLFHASTLRVTIWLEASSAQNSMAAVSAQGSKGWVLMRRLNSSCGRSMA